MNEVLSRAEIEQLIMSLARCRGMKGESFTKVEAECVVAWAEHVRIDNAMLLLIMQGRADINWANDDVEFSLREGTEAQP